MLQRRINAIELFRNLDWFTIILYLIMVLAGVISIKVNLLVKKNAMYLS